MERNIHLEQETSNILLMRMQNYVILFDKYRLQINKLHAKYPNYEDIPVYNIDSMMYLFLTANRWNNLVKTVFDGMEPPVMKNEGTDNYSYKFIKDADMTPQQKQRVTKLSYTMLPAMWSHLIYIEQVYICSTVFGMYNNMKFIAHYLSNNPVQPPVYIDKTTQTCHEIEEEEQHNMSSSKRVKR